MWVDRKLYEQMRDEWVKNHEECRVLGQRMSAMDTTLDWFRIRVTQLEKERAQMVERYTGVKIEVPNIVRVPDVPVEQVLSEVASFDDVGDDIAKRLGIGWDASGKVVYQKA